MENGREEYTLRVFENRMLRKMHRPRRENVNRNWENCTVSSFVNFFLLTKYYSDAQVKVNEIGA